MMLNIGFVIAILLFACARKIHGLYFVQQIDEVSIVSYNNSIAF